jgi:hypothetical protein
VQLSIPWLSAKFNDVAFLILCLAAVVLTVVLSITGALSGRIATDKASDIAPLASNNPWGEWRHPLYGTVASWFGSRPTAAGTIGTNRSTCDLRDFLPVDQWLAFNWRADR